MSLLDVQNQTKIYSEQYSVLSDMLTNLDKEVKEIQDKYRKKLSGQLAKVQDAREKLTATIEANSDCFDKPKTQIFYNIRVGYAKGKGKKDFDNAVTVKLIEKHFPDKTDSLIRVTKKVISKALDTLEVSELKKIGVEIINAGDEIVISHVDSKIEKMIEKILNAGKDDDEDPIIILGKA